MIFSRTRKFPHFAKTTLGEDSYWSYSPRLDLFRPTQEFIVKTRCDFFRNWARLVFFLSSGTFHPRVEIGGELIWETCYGPEKDKKNKTTTTAPEGNIKKTSRNENFIRINQTVSTQKFCDISFLMAVISYVAIRTELS